MKKAAVDIGTNSTRLYIADVDHGVRGIKKYTRTTRLGSGVDRDRRLRNEAMERTLGVLLEYKRIAESYGIREIKAIATSAVRDAANGEQFLDMVKSGSGMDIDIISGKEEAELGFIGASSVLDGKYGVVCDIGGGSTELICGDDGGVDVIKSIDVGAVRMTERFLTPDMIEDRQIRASGEYIRDAVYRTLMDIKERGDFTLVGIGGTITNLAAIDLELDVYDRDRVHGYELMRDRIEHIFERLLGSSFEERRKIIGLQPGRADILPAGTLILKIIMDVLDCESIVVSEHDNLDGIMIKNGL